MKKNNIKYILLIITLLACSKLRAQESINLSGKWEVRLDPENKGVQQKWYLKTFPDSLILPGSCQEQGFGNVPSATTEWWDGKINDIWAKDSVYEEYRSPDNFKIYHWLIPQKYYVGSVWYNRKIVIPENWADKYITLFLERAHWQTTVYVNGREAGTQNGLGTAHEYNLTDFLSPGEHTISICVNNSKIVDMGARAHSISDQTHALWNGIIGAIELRKSDKVFIENIEVHPDIANKKAMVKLAIKNLSGQNTKATIRLKCHSYNTVHPVVFKEIVFSEKIQEQSFFEYELPIGNKMQLWDEFNPVLYRLTATVATSNTQCSKEAVFGMREIETQGHNIMLNGKRIHLRGNLDCAVFPVEGYPKMDKEWWHNLWKTYKNWGFNHVRFHSWCPPEAAFIAADEAGLYLQPEVGEWATVKTKEQKEFLMQESQRILREYGNHPSFIMMALGNERSCDKEILEGLINDWKKDTRHIYSGKCNGYPILDDFDFYVSRESPQENRARYFIEWPVIPERSWFYEKQPATNIDFRQVIADYPKPFISHEIGQHCSYPDVANQAAKYTGTMNATWLDIARAQLEERGMGHQIDDFVQASGKWQVQLYKEEIEANLRTRGMAGFQLLSLQDFPGQGSAPVGILDAFYGNKGYVTSEEFRKFCNSSVILARMKKRTWFTNEIFHADIELYHFGNSPIQINTIHYQVFNDAGKLVYSKKQSGGKFELGQAIPVGDIDLDLQQLKPLEKYNFVVSFDDKLKNNWNFWVYPAQIETVPTSDEIIISKKWDENTREALRQGKKVLLLPNSETLRGKLKSCFTTFFWTTFDFYGGMSAGAGLLTNPDHPVFNEFPTDFHTNWQWWELLKDASIMILDDFYAKHPFPKTYSTIIQLVPSWKVNRKLAVLAEAKIGKGSLMICTMDIESNLEQRKVANQFRNSLLTYMLSDEFKPNKLIDEQMLNSIFYP